MCFFRADGRVTALPCKFQFAYLKRPLRLAKWGFLFVVVKIVICVSTYLAVVWALLLPTVQKREKVISRADYLSHMENKLTNHPWSISLSVLRAKFAFSSIFNKGIGTRHYRLGRGQIVFNSLLKCFFFVGCVDSTGLHLLSFATCRSLTPTTQGLKFLDRL